MQIQISQTFLQKIDIPTTYNKFAYKQEHTKDKIRSKASQRSITNNQSWLGLSREETVQKYQALLNKNHTVVRNTDTDNDLNLIHFASFDYLPLLKLLLRYKHQICIEVSRLKTL